MSKFVCHFSCGVTSAVATMITIMEHGRNNVEIVYADPGSEHEDNQRFRLDFEELIDHPIKVLHSEKYEDIYDVFTKENVLKMPRYAPCTIAMKKEPIQEYLKDRVLTEVQVIGYTGEERGRIARWEENNPMVELSCPLVDAMLDKKDCMAICDYLGLDLPYMYKLGYSNANCIGCVKAESLGYWAAVRQDFPEIFEKTAWFERNVGKKGAAICYKRRKPLPGEEHLVEKSGYVRERIFLDHLPEDTPMTRNVSISCGYTCGMQDMEEIVDELAGQPSFFGLDYQQRLGDFFCGD